MSLDGRLLSLAKDRLDARRHARELERDRREREVYAKNPRVRELDSAIRTAMAKTFAAALDHADGLESRIEAVREECQNLEAERSEEIISAGFPYDYLDMGYICDDCQDTGFIGSKPCACLLELYAEEQRRALSDLFKLGSESFDSFDLSWYDENPDPVTGVSPREHMEAVKEMCYRYADGFGKRSMNLLLTGAPGLGKTFLSACIARTVSEHGFSVVYETAQTVFQRFEDQALSVMRSPHTGRSGNGADLLVHPERSLRTDKHASHIRQEDRYKYEPVRRRHTFALHASNSVEAGRRVSGTAVLRQRYTPAPPDTQVSRGFFSIFIPQCISYNLSENVITPVDFSRVLHFFHRVFNMRYVNAVLSVFIFRANTWPATLR